MHMIYLQGIDWRRKRLSIVTFWADKKEETLPEHHLKQRESRSLFCISTLMFKLGELPLL